MHTSPPAADVDLVGTDIVFGTTPIGQVLDVIRDPVSQRVTTADYDLWRHPPGAWRFPWNGWFAAPRRV